MKALTNTELITFCGQLALILRSGISTLEGLSLMLEDTPKGEGHEIIQTVLSEMELTGNLSQSLQTAGVFPDYMCSMVEIGEMSGKLDDVMDSLAGHYRREESLSATIRSAVAYPLIMIGMMVIVMTVLIVKVMPVFRQVFEQLGTGMTGVSKAILDFGSALGSYSMVFLVLALIIAAVFVWLFFTKSGNRRRKTMSYKFFLTRGLSRKIACSRFASGMHLALGSGLDVDQSLEMAARLVEHPEVHAQIEEIRRLTAEGSGFTEAVTETGIFSGVYERMLSIGYRAGALDDVMGRISERCDEEIEARMNILTSRLEPTLVAILSIVVGMILLSVMLPLMSVMSNIG